MILAAWRGGEAEASELIEATSAEAATAAMDVQQLREIGSVQRPWPARGRARRSLGGVPARSDRIRIVAGARAGRGGVQDRGPALLELALEWLSERTRVIGSGWAAGIEARVRALVSEGEVAEGLVPPSIEHLSAPACGSSSPAPASSTASGCAASAAALDAREQLRTALEAFTSMGAEAFARRAERELLATGERARKRTRRDARPAHSAGAQIARLAAQGNTNREIAAQLFISPSTVEYHLRKVFRKLGVKSRTQLAHRLS